MTVHQLNDTAHDSPIKVLRIDASARQNGSTTRALGDDLIARLNAVHGEIVVTERDLSSGLPFLNEGWVGANFTDPDQRSEEQNAELALSDELIAELKDADVLVIGVPVYNFGVPAVLKAWVDLIARARVTFRYTENGPVGLLEGKKAYLVAASGGTAIGSEIDFATPYMRHVLGFVGVHDVTVIAADRQMADETAQERARGDIAELAA